MKILPEECTLCNPLKSHPIRIIILLISYIDMPTGYMDKELFVKWLQEIFIKHCGRPKPVLLLMDNHISHVGADAIDLAKKHEVGQWIKLDMCRTEIKSKFISCSAYSISYML